MCFVESGVEQSGGDYMWASKSGLEMLHGFDGLVMDG
jgi:hypothetical protein